jgi:hypothetical protein
MTVLMQLTPKDYCNDVLKQTPNSAKQKSENPKLQKLHTNSDVAACLARYVIEPNFPSNQSSSNI